jgi:cell division protease FtsH
MHKNKKSEQKKENEFDVNKIINKFKVTNNKKSPVNPFVLLLIGLVIWSFASLFSQRLGIGESVSKDIALNELVAQIKNGEVSKVTIVGNSLKAELKNGDIVKTTKEPQISFYELLDLQKVDPQLVSGGIFEEQSFPWFDVIGSIAFPLVSILLLWWIFRQAGKGAGGVFSIGKSKAKLFSKEDSKKTGFGDVAGANEIKDELFEIVDFLKKPEKYRKLGARIPKGVLLIGPSGVGKTLSARMHCSKPDVCRKIWRSRSWTNSIDSA